LQPLQQLTYLELSENQISIISEKSFLPLKKLSTLKLNENRLGDNPKSLKSIEACVNLR
jgi:Leucine-rich repeat (LRR) protein